MGLRPRRTVAKQMPVTESKVAGFLSFGNDNLLPQTLLAMAVRADFIEGNGLYDRGLSNMIVNRQGQRLDEVHRANASNLAFGEVQCLHLSYNVLGQLVGLQSLPWELIRFAKPDDLGVVPYAGYFPYLGSTLYKKQDKDFRKLYLYNPDPEVVRSQIKASGGIQNYYGQLLYRVAGRNRGDVYHKPYYFGGTKNFETEGQLANYDYNVVTGDFTDAGIVKALAPKPKPVTRITTDNYGNTISETVETYDEEKGVTSRFQQSGRFEGAQGADNAGNVLIFEFETKDELDAFEFMSRSPRGLADQYNALRTNIADLIARRTRVPNELLNLRRAGGISPTGDEIRIGSKLMQQTANPYQRLNERTYEEIFSHWHIPIVGRNFATENLDYFRDDVSVAQPG